MIDLLLSLSMPGTHSVHAGPSRAACNRGCCHDGHNRRAPPTPLAPTSAASLAIACSSAGARVAACGCRRRRASWRSGPGLRSVAQQLSRPRPPQGRSPAHALTCRDECRLARQPAAHRFFLSRRYTRKQSIDQNATPGLVPPQHRKTAAAIFYGLAQNWLDHLTNVRGHAYASLPTRGANKTTPQSMPLQTARMRAACTAKLPIRSAVVISVANRSPPPERDLAKQLGVFGARGADCA